MKRMRFETTENGPRVTVSDNGVETEVIGSGPEGSNIYLGRVVQVDLLEGAYLIDYGGPQNGVLPFGQIASRYSRKSGSADPGLRVGMAILVQSVQEDDNGASFTTFVSLPGRYLLAMPFGTPLSGVVREAALDGRARPHLKAHPDLLLLSRPGEKATDDELDWDLLYLVHLWQAIEGAGKSAPPPFLIYQDSSPVIRAIRDHFTADIEEILFDSADYHEQALQFVSHVMPQMVHKVKGPSGPAPSKPASAVEPGLFGQLWNRIFRRNRGESGN